MWVLLIVYCVSMIFVYIFTISDRVINHLQIKSKYIVYHFINLISLKIIKVQR